MPRIAVAAATRGETRWVRPPLPCRPSKLRLDVEALRSPGCQLVGVHTQAHRAAGAAPLATGLLEHHVEALVLGLEPHPHRSGYDEQPCVLRDVAALEHLGRGPQVLDPSVGARADEHGVHGDLAHRGAGGQAHVLQRLLRRDHVAGVLEVGRVRHRTAERDALAGVGPPGDERRHRRGVEHDLLVVLGVLIGDEGPPVLDGGVPVGALRRLGTSLDVVEGHLVGRDQAGLGAPLDAHVADRHAGFHRELLDGLAAVLDDVALPAPGAGVRDQRQHQVLGGDAGRQRAVDGDGHRLRLRLHQGLGGEHVLDLGGADAERDRAERAVGRGVGVAADDGHARLGQTELRADDVHDPLLDVAERVQPDPELGGVGAQRVDLGARHRVGDRLVPVEGRNVVVLGREGQVGASYGASGEPQPFERLRRGDLVDQVQVDEQQVGLTLGAADHVLVPDLLGQGLSHDHCTPSCVSMWRQLPSTTLRLHPMI